MQSLGIFLAVVIVALAVIAVAAFLLVILYLRQQSSSARTKSRVYSYQARPFLHLKDDDDLQGSKRSSLTSRRTNTTSRIDTSRPRSLMSTTITKSASPKPMPTKTTWTKKKRDEEEEKSLGEAITTTKQVPPPLVNIEERRVYMSSNPISRPIPVSSFTEYYREVLKADGYWRLATEFEDLAEVSERTLYANQPMVTYTHRKDKYRDILPYKHSLVKLSAGENGNQVSDYINASFIAGDAGTREYISTQSPMSTTRLDFYRMLLEYKVNIIVTLNNLAERNCIVFFPVTTSQPDIVELDSHLYRIELSADRQETLLDTSVSIVHFLDAATNELVLECRHFHFHGWRDFGTPAQTVLDLIESVRVARHHLHHHQVEKPPVVVHCSAGVGRTGVYMALDQIWTRITLNASETLKSKQLAAVASKPTHARSNSRSDAKIDPNEATVDIFGTVYRLRMYRRGMVQTEMQYQFLYDTVDYILNHKRLIQFESSEGRQVEEPSSPTHWDTRL